MKRHLNIRRFDSEANSTFAWLVQVQRNHQISIKLFSDSIYGGKRKALQAAIEFRALLWADASYEHKIWRRSILRRNNKSGFTGVGRYDTVANKNTGTRQVFWLASWVDEHGASRKRKFSVLRYGERKAKQLAIAERERRLKEVCAAKCN